MISDPKNLSEQLCNLSERLGIEMRTLNRTKVSTVNGLIPDNSGAITVDVGVKTVNGTQPDSNGNVTIQTGGDTSSLIPKTGDRGELAGYGLFEFNVNFPEGVGIQDVWVIDKNTEDSKLCAGGTVRLENIPQSHWFDTGIHEGSCETWTKVVFLYNAYSVELGEGWNWPEMTAPEIGMVGFLVLHVNADIGVVSYIRIL